MKFLVAVLLTALLSFISGLYLPWWGIALVSFGVSAIIAQRPGWSFLAGFLALFLLWGLLAWSIDSSNNSLLSRKIAQILPLDGSPLLLMLVTAFVGALVGGTSALSGAFMVTRRRSKDQQPAE